MVKDRKWGRLWVIFFPPIQVLKEKLVALNNHPGLSWDVCLFGARLKRKHSPSPTAASSRLQERQVLPWLACAPTPSQPRSGATPGKGTPAWAVPAIRGLEAEEELGTGWVPQ